MDNSIKNIFNKIGEATDNSSLENALAQFDTLNKEQQAELASALEQEVILGVGAFSAQEIMVIQAVAEMPFLFDSEADDLFPFHASVMLAKKVLDIKGDKASPSIQFLGKKLEGLSDEEYNNTSKMASIFVEFINEVKKKPQDKQSLTKNPFSR